MNTTKKTKKQQEGGLLQSLPAYLRNKYALTLLGFAIYLLFFDHYSLLKQYQLHQTLTELREEKAYYIRTIEESRELRASIKADEEKFARERYYMKRPDQDVYIVE